MKNIIRFTMLCVVLIVLGACANTPEPATPLDIMTENLANSETLSVINN